MSFWSAFEGQNRETQSKLDDEFNAPLMPKKNLETKSGFSSPAPLRNPKLDGPKAKIEMSELIDPRIKQSLVGWFLDAREELLAVRLLIRRVRVLGTFVLKIRGNFVKHDLHRMFNVCTSCSVPSGPRNRSLHCSKGCGPSLEVQQTSAKLVLPKPAM